jgi:hypothetical protein
LGPLNQRPWPGGPLEGPVPTQPAPRIGVAGAVERQAVGCGFRGHRRCSWWHVPRLAAGVVAQGGEDGWLMSCLSIRPGGRRKEFGGVIPGCFRLSGIPSCSYISHSSTHPHPFPKPPSGSGKERTPPHADPARSALFPLCPDGPRHPLHLCLWTATPAAVAGGGSVPGDSRARRGGRGAAASPGIRHPDTCLGRGRRWPWREPVPWLAGVTGPAEPEWARASRCVLPGPIAGVLL